MVIGSVITLSTESAEHTAAPNTSSAARLLDGLKTAALSLIGTLDP